MRQKIEDALMRQAGLIGFLGVVFIALGISGDRVARKNREAETYLFFEREGRKLTEAFDAGCLDSKCRWWPSWSVICKRKKS